MICWISPCSIVFEELEDDKIINVAHSYFDRVILSVGKTAEGVGLIKRTIRADYGVERVRWKREDKLEKPSVAL